MNLSLNFESAERWTWIIKLAVTIVALYPIAVVGLFVKGNLLGSGFLFLSGLAFYVLRHARRVSMGADGPRRSRRVLHLQPL